MHSLSLFLGVEAEEVTPTVVPKPVMFPYISKKNPDEDVKRDHVPTW